MNLKLFYLALLFCCGIFAQETPPIVQYSTSDYNGENQNWDITQDSNNFIYVANNEGLLEFNGNEWHLYPTPNQSIPRSIFSHNGRIYMGSFMDFGYYERNEKGLLEYTSIPNELEVHLSEDETIWHIKEFKGYILFQSYDRIYFYNPVMNDITFKYDKNNFYRIFKTDNRLLVYKRDGAIISIENGSEKLIAKIPQNLGIQFVLEMYDTDEGLVLLTRNKGLYRVENGTLIKWEVLDRLQYKDLKIFCGLMLRDGSWVLGTISNGIIHISEEGKLLNEIDLTNGLSNNTVLNIFEDSYGNVWVALDNGIDCINMESYISEYNDFEGIIGTVYTSIIHQEYLYVGTNQGLFSKQKNSAEKLQLVKGTEGQVWSLFTNEDDLLCGHTDGTFLVENNSSRQIGSTLGTWDFRQIPGKNNELLIGHYSGMSVLKKIDDNWIDLGAVEGFNFSTRFFEILDDFRIFVNHESKGVYTMHFDYDNHQFVNVELVNNVERNKGSGLLKVGDSILYKNKVGVYTLNGDRVKKNEVLSKLTETDEYISGRLVLDKKDRLWSFNRSSLTYAEKAPVTGDFVLNRLAIDNNRKKAIVSFENVSLVDDNKYLLGKTDGYLLIDIDEIAEAASKVYLNKIKITPRDSAPYYLAKEQYTELDFTDNTVAFFYSTPRFNKYEDIKFQFLLSERDSKWSNWSRSGSVQYENLAYGDYEFQVRSKVGEKVSENTSVFTFRINPPLYLSSVAILFYIIGGLSIMFVTHRFYKTYYRKKHEHELEENQRLLELERVKSEQELIRLRNEKLNQQIAAKNREVAISMMSLVKRNEVLKSIQKELQKNDAINHSDPVFNLIKKNTNRAEDWDFFKTAFDQADTDFLKRAKVLHPKLNANDLKFCAYLRLNLSSKDIAPLLNISVKSVEVRRYRLRKKLDLDHKTNLIDYILSI